MTNTGTPSVSTGAVTDNGTLLFTRNSGGAGQVTFTTAISGNGAVAVGNTQSGTTVTASNLGRARFNSTTAFTNFTGSIHVLGTNGGGNLCFFDTQTTTNQNVTIDAGGYMSILGTATTSIGGLNGAGSVSMNFSSGTATLALGNGDANGNFSGVISQTLLGGPGTIAVTTTGMGTQTLSGANSYTGATTINDGTIIVDSSAIVGNDWSQTSGHSIRFGRPR